MSDLEVVEPKLSEVRRSLTIRSNAARQVAVNFMPSRQLPYNTIRLRRTNSEQNALLEEECDVPDGGGGATDTQVDVIVREMEQHQRLMEDNPEAEGLRREALRDLPQGLTMKRDVRAKLSASVSLRSKRRPISLWKRMKYRISFAWKRGQDRFHNVLFSMELWYDVIRNIEGHFGSAVGSYFYFLRWLFVCDVLLAAVVVAFVVVPKALHDEGGTGGPWGFMDFISGKGGYEDSLLFYGHYDAGDIAARGALSYSMPFAYLFTVACLYLAVFAVLCYRTAYSYRRNFIETSGGLSHVFANKVFCGWDFGIVSPHAAALSATSLYNEFKELLNEQNKHTEKEPAYIKFLQYVANCMITGLVMALIAGVEYGIWSLLSADAATPHWEVVVSLVVTATVAIMPVLLHYIVKLEFYSPRTALYVTLARTWLLDVGTLMMLFYFWSQSSAHCWETLFGQETYRLVLLDSLVSLFILPIVEVVRGLLFRWKMTSSAPEFNIAYNSLTLIYNQALLWFGMLFSPLLVVAVTVKFLMLFYVKRECAVRACQPARKIWRAAQTQTVMYMLVTLSLFTTLFGFGSLFLKMESTWCGPFRGYSHVYKVLSEGVLHLSDHPRLLNVILFVTRPGVIGFLILLLCVSVYYMRARARAQRSMVQLLRHMLVLQAKDKDFLLSAIAKVSNGEWLYSPKPADAEDADTHTWRYLNEVRKPSNAGFHLAASRGSERPRSLLHEPERTRTTYSDGDTDSSFSWQGSGGQLNTAGSQDSGKKLA